MSPWQSKLAWDDPQYDQLQASIREACDYPFAGGRRAGPIAFRDTVECLLGNPAAFDDHWSRQVDLLDADVIDYQIVGRFERFGQDFHAILRRLHAPAGVIDIASRVFNPIRPMALAAVYDPPLAGRVYGHYSAAAEHRMNLAVHYLEVTGCAASGIVSDQDPVKAVRSETRARDYDAVIVATGRLGGSWLAHLLHLDPVHQLRRRWGKPLTVCQPRPRHDASTPAS